MRTSALPLFPLVLACGQLAANAPDASTSDDAGTTPDASEAGDTSEGGVETLTTAVHPAIIATDGQRVFWSTSDAPSTLNAISVDGGTPEQLFVADPALIVDGPIVDSTYVYCMTSSGSTASILRMPLTGGAPTTLDTTVAFPHFAIAGATAFDFDSIAADGGYELVLESFATAGGPTSTAADLGATKYVWPTALAADSSSAYVGIAAEASPATALSKISFGNIVPTPLATIMDAIDALAVDSNELFIAARAAIMRLADDGTPVTLVTLTPSSQSPPTNMALDATNVYFTDSGGGFVKKLARNGGPMTTLATLAAYESFPSQTQGRAIAVDATHVYWATQTAIMRVAK